MKKALGRRTLSVLLSVLILVLTTVFSMAYPATAAYTNSNCVPSDFFTSGISIAEAEDWEPDLVTGTSLIHHSDGKALRLYSKTGTAEIKADFAEGVNTNGASEIGVYVTSISEGLCTVILNIEHDSGTSTVSAQIPKAEEYYVFVPIPDGTKLIYSINAEISVTAENSDNNSVSSVSAIVKNAVLSDIDHKNNIDKFSVFDIGKLDSENKVSDAGTVTGSAVVANTSGEDFAAIVKLSGSRGGITFHFSTDGKDFTVCGSAVITEERTSYVFPVGNITHDSQYKLEFTGTGESDVRLDSVNFIPVMTFDKNENLGVVSKCAFADDTITVSGSITRDAAVEYIKGDVCLYEIPIWANEEEILTEEPAASMTMSTSFSFSLPTTADYSVFNSYVVAIKDKDGVYPLTSPVYPSFANLAESSTGTVSVSGIPPEEAFTYGFDRYVMDIDLSKLILDKRSQGSTVFTYDGYSYYLNKDILSDIGNNARFLSAAGIGIIFRVSSSGTSSISPQSADDCRTIAAVTAYISDNYSPVGIIFGMEQKSVSDISQRAYRTASLLRMVSAAAGNGITILVPVDGTADGEAFAWLLSKYVSFFPKASLEMLITNKSEKNDISEGIMACASDGGSSFQFTVSLSPDENTNISVSEMTMGNTGVSYLIDADGSSLPELSNNSYKTYDVVTDFTGDEENTVTLWDFADSYDSKGFTVPAGAAGIFTGTDDALEDFTGIPAGRALKTVLGDSSGVIIAEPAFPMNLESYPNVRFLISGKSDSPFSVDIIFISGKQRAVFNADFSGSGVFAPVCDLSKTDIAGKVERIAVVLKSGGPVDFSIASITAAGIGNGVDIYITEASNLDNAQNTSDSQFESIPAELFAAVIVTVATIIVFVVLTKKKAQ